MIHELPYDILEIIITCIAFNMLFGTYSTYNMWSNWRWHWVVGSSVGCASNVRALLGSSDRLCIYFIWNMQYRTNDIMLRSC